MIESKNDTNNVILDFAPFLYQSRGGSKKYYIWKWTFLQEKEECCLCVWTIEFCMCIPSLISSQFFDISYFLKKLLIVSINSFVIILSQVYNFFSSFVNVMFYLSVRLLFVVLVYNRAKTNFIYIKMIALLLPEFNVAFFRAKILLL